MKNLRVKVKGREVKDPKKSSKKKPLKEKKVPRTFRRGREKSIKKQPRKPGGIFKKLIIACFLALVCFGIYIGYQRWQENQRYQKAKKDAAQAQGGDVEVCDNPLDPSCWIGGDGAFAPKLEQEDGVTGVLIVGLDTRDEGGAASGLMNTDSIIAALYNHNTNKTTLISLPRDLYVPFRPAGRGPYHTKINAVYATGESRSDVDDGFDLLEETVEEIIGKQLQYRILVKLKAVEEGVEAVGGIDIEVPTYLKTMYPNDYRGKDGKPWDMWLYYEFQPGVQHMDGEHALVWARFRKVIGGDMSYASDFSRAERQQQVIDALREKALDDKGSTLERAEKYWGIFETVQKNVEFNIGFEEVFAGLSIMDEAEGEPINMVLDPNFGGINNFIYTPAGRENGYNIEFKDESFTSVQAYMDLIWEYPELFDEEANILIVNKLGRGYNSTDPAIKFRDEVRDADLPMSYNDLIMITEQKGTTSGVVIVDMTKGKKTGTTKFLAEYFGAVKIIEDPENYGFTQSGYEEDVKIIVNP